jgi:hypothetical protein
LRIFCPQEKTKMKTMLSTSALSDQFDRLYKLVLDTESDSDFYRAVFFYCDYVVNNPVASRLLAEDQAYYAKHHSELWIKRDMNDDEADEAAEATSNLERLSLYANFSLILVRIYWPIDDFRKTIGSDANQDPVALLLLKGIKNITNKRWSKNNLKMHNRWFEGKRSQYLASLRRFHTQLVSAIGNISDTSGKKVELPREPIYFNSRTGDFSIRQAHGTFNPRGQECHVFSVLYESPDRQASYLDLIRSFRPNVEEVSKARKDELSKILQAIKEKLGEERGVIQNVKNVGYRLVVSGREETRE